MPQNKNIYKGYVKESLRPLKTKKGTEQNRKKKKTQTPRRQQASLAYFLHGVTQAGLPG